MINAFSLRGYFWLFFFIILFALFVFKRISSMIALWENILSNRYLYIYHYRFRRLDPIGRFWRHEGAHDPFILFLNCLALHEILANPALTEWKDIWVFFRINFLLLNNILLLNLSWLHFPKFPLLDQVLKRFFALYHYQPTIYYSACLFVSKFMRETLIKCIVITKIRTSLVNILEFSQHWLNYLNVCFNLGNSYRLEWWLQHLLMLKPIFTKFYCFLLCALTCRILLLHIGFCKFLLSNVWTWINWCNVIW